MSSFSETLHGLFQYAGSLSVIALLAIYIFKVDPSVFLPSVAMFVLYVLVLLAEKWTRFAIHSPKDQNIIGIVYIVILIATWLFGIFLMHKNCGFKVSFFVSLPFQIYYALCVCYYGGLIITHKFD